MAQTVDISFVPALQDTIVNLFAEDPDAIRSTVRNRQITGKTDKWERLGGVRLEQVTTRHQATPHTPFTHSARLAVMQDFAGSEKLDKLDEVKMMIDPKNDYTRGLQRAFRVELAYRLTEALDGSAVSVDNQDARTSNALPSSQVISNGGTGLTLAKLRQSIRILGKAGVPVNDGGLTILTSFEGIEDLLADSQVTSSDFSSLNALMNGGIPNGSRFMGLRWITIGDALPDENAVLTGGTPNPYVLPKSGNIRTLFVYHRDAVGLSMAKDLEVNVDRLPTHLNSWQVMVQTSFGFVRILDAGVVTIDIDESV